MAEKPSILFLLDGMALIYRAHFAFMRNPRRTSGGLNTSAVFGFVNTLTQLLQAHQPSHLAVVFDTPVPTFRHEIFPDYKAQREEMPEDLATAIPLVRELMQALRVPVIAVDGWEADDVIATLARRAGGQGVTTYMVTPDKDYCQLVDEHTLICKPGRAGDLQEILGIPEVLARWGVERIDQVIDIMALWGDASDNIPGVPGIGEKTAQKLIAQYGSLENLLEHAGELKGKQKENLINHANASRLAKELVTIRDDAPVDLTLDDLRRGEPDREQVRTMFRELEFTTLARRLLGEEADSGEGQGMLFGGQAASVGAKVQAPPAVEESAGFKTLADVAHDYHVVDTPEGVTALLETLRQAGGFCFDLETTGLDGKTAEIVGLALAIKPHEAWYVPFPADQDRARALLEAFRPVLLDETLEKTGHNLKFDMGVLAWHDVDVRGRLFDTMLASQVAAPEGRHGMDALAEQWLGYRPVALSSLIGEKGKEQTEIRAVPPETLAEYAAEDADVTLQLREKLVPMLKEKNAERVFHEIESPLLPVLVDMERTGVRLDIAALEESSIALGKELEQLEQRIHEVAGLVFNINSPKQLGEVLFEHLKLEAKPKKTRTGQYQTSEQVLARLAVEHELPRLILEQRACAKLKSNYVDTLPTVVFPRTGRVHTTYSQAVTATGRMQSAHPNLQNIPIRTQRGREIRKAFVPGDERRLLLSADYSQIELRVIAHISGDKALCAAFADNLDVHTATAAKVHGVALDQVTGEMRRQAKMVNFGVIYGISAFGLAQRLGIPRAQAGTIIDAYFRQYPGVKDYIDKTIAFAQAHEYVETLSGRRRYLRDINSRNATVRGAEERNAINTPIQGTAADMIKLAMVAVFEQLAAKGLQTKMILQVHDELVFDMLRDEEDEVRELVERCMKQALPLDVPIVVEMGVGEHWLAAH